MVERHSSGKSSLGKRLSKASVAGPIMHTSGLVCPEEPTAAKQASAIFREIEDLLSKTHSSKGEILHCQLFIRDMKYFEEVNDVYDQWIDSDSVPSRTCIVAQLPNPKALIEVTTVASIRATANNG